MAEFSLAEESSDKIEDILVQGDLVKVGKNTEYVNLAMAFDIEASSWMEKRKIRRHEELIPHACEYCWVFGINGKTVTGRTWEQFLDVISAVRKFYGCDSHRRVVIYIHNLAYEFQWIRKKFRWSKVFSLDERRPVVARTVDGIEFRCSYILSNYSLETIGKNLTKYKVAKMSGDLDYTLVRSPETPMTEKEMKYVIHDGLVVMAYIQETIEQLGDITKIPMTATGFVRRHCRDACLYASKKSHKDHAAVSSYIKYHGLMKSLRITSVQEYAQLKRAFQGGFTHASCWYSGKTVDDVTSYDFTSSYPAVMVMERFPMSTGELVEIHSIEEFHRNIDLYCCMFDITFEGLEEYETFEHPLSFSKCSRARDYELDNGRVVRASRITTTITDVDFLILRKFYRWKRMTIRNFRRYRRGYLPREFVNAILDLYVRKTTLKGVEDMEVEYLASKAKLNASFGMTVTDICRPENIYEDEQWSTVKPDVEKMINDYNRDPRRFLFYPWGVWVTAYARRNLFEGIYDAGHGPDGRCDFVYSDTDSIKITHGEDHKAFIDSYNQRIMRKIERVSQAQGIPIERFMPKTIQGETKIIGVWDFDGHYRRFRTLGAKRYLIEKDDGTHSLTVSGINKRKAVPYLEKLAKEKHRDIFSFFVEDMVIPGEHSGRNVHTYIDEEDEGMMTDYLGREFYYHEDSSVNITETTYTMSMVEDYVRFLAGYREVNI